MHGDQRGRHHSGVQAAARRGEYERLHLAGQVWGNEAQAKLSDRVEALLVEADQEQARIEVG